MSGSRSSFSNCTSITWKIGGNRKLWKSWQGMALAHVYLLTNFHEPCTVQPSGGGGGVLKHRGAFTPSLALASFPPSFSSISWHTWSRLQGLKEVFHFNFGTRPLSHSYTITALSILQGKYISLWWAPLLPFISNTRHLTYSTAHAVNWNLILTNIWCT